MNYRDFLKDELESRVQANPNYSLRAFARDLRISPSSLSMILKSQRGLSRQRARRIAERLSLGRELSEHFCDLVAAEHGRSQTLREVAQKKLTDEPRQSARALDADQFRVISDWYHLTIREMVRRDDFLAEPAWIANRLGISPAEAERAWERLRRLGLVREEDGRYRVADFVGTTDGVPAESIRQCHAQLLEKARVALVHGSPTERNHSAIIMNIEASQIEEANRLIREFRHRLERKLERTRAGPADRTYCLNVQFFGLEQSSKENPT